MLAFYIPALIVLWLIHEALVAPRCPYMDYESRLDRLEGGGQPLSAFEPLNLSTHAATDTQGAQDNRA